MQGVQYPEKAEKHRCTWPHPCNTRSWHVDKSLGINKLETVANEYCISLKCLELSKYRSIDIFDNPYRCKYLPKKSHIRQALHYMNILPFI